MNEFQVERATEQRNQKQAKAPVAQPTSDIVAGQAWPSEFMDQAIAQFEEGEENVVETASTLADNEIAMLMKNADILIQAKEHRLAMNLLRGVLMRAPDCPQALLKMGSALREEGRFEEALKCFRALRKSDSAVEASILIADTLYLGERDDMALATYREVLKKLVQDEPRLFGIYKNIGNIHVRAGDFESAEEFYNKAYLVEPNSDILMVNYGTLELQRDNMGEAVERFRRAVEINPMNDKGWVGLALVHRHMGDRELAWANVQRAMDIDAMNRTAIRLCVEWGVDDHKFSLAISRLQDYLAVQGEDVEMCFTLAKLLTHVGMLREARIEMERVLALDPSIQGGEAVMKALQTELSKQVVETV